MSGNEDRLQGGEPRFLCSDDDLSWSSLAKKIRHLVHLRKRGTRRNLPRSGGANKLRFEALEPRVLLSADLSYTATDTSDLTLRVVDAGGGNTLQLVDTQDPTIILATESVSNIDGSSGYGARVDSGGFDVTLRIDDSVDVGEVMGGITFVGGDGVSSLVGA